MNATAHANTSASPVTAVGSDHRGMFTNILVGAAIPLLALELAHRFEAAPLSAWQGIPRILLASAVAVAMAIFLSKRIARKQTQQAIANLDTLEQRLTAGGSNSSDDLVAFGDVAAALDHEHQLLPNAQTSVSSRARFQQLVDASQEMSQAARELGNRTEKLSQEGRSYVGQINDTSAAVDEIVDSIQQVADNSSASSKVAAEAPRTATVGSQAVSNTIKGMQRIRGQVQSNAERIKQLGESTQQIGEIVQLISDVADRTSLLALNASIQAAMAGEAGQGFGVVAEEVEQLSQRCNDATKQMTRLVKGVQLETAEAVAGMEESIAEVVQGSKLASQAGEALADIDSVSARLAELIQSISAATKQQVRGGLLASRSMNEISAIMHGSASATKQAAQSAGQLAIMAESHWSNVERFHPTFQPTPLGTTVQGTTALQENAAAAGSCSLEETAECQPTGLDIAEMEPSPGELNDNTTEAALAGSATS